MVYRPIIHVLAYNTSEELQIPVIAFRTCSAYCLWVYFHISKLVGEGEIPVSDENLDKPVACISGLENVLRLRDLPSICRYPKGNPVLQFFIGETTALTRASALILNTSHEIERPAISKLGPLFTNIYTIGPLRASPSDSFNGVLLQEDRSCMTWLDSQPSRSVLYISFGSLVILTRDQILEFWHGIVNSGKRFLWVIRSDLIIGESGTGTVPVELDQGTEERGCIVGWAPQEEVLGHPAVAGFLTHSGWNSTMESMVAGVPMICWPQLADQQVNSRGVSEVWKNGFDMKDTCDRSTVEKLVRDLMEDKREEIMESTDKIAKMAREAVKEGGSSYTNLEKLIEDIKSMASKSKV
ncbi:Glycosyltransferase [Melia azedarach]|uniref:Glycosyltransferase n=1 Tax=Melia azedarach TaxID=155640 RepID=A0ACC1X071_MELAZ|nr:Glycosyltransferase [Melia azedarach]